MIRALESQEDYHLVDRFYTAYDIVGITRRYGLGH